METLVHKYGYFKMSAISIMGYILDTDTCMTLAECIGYTETLFDVNSPETWVSESCRF